MMNDRELKIAELEGLLWQLRDGSISVAGRQRIESLVTGDAELRRFYIRHGMLCGGLRWMKAGGKVAGISGQWSGVGGRMEEKGERREGWEAELPESPNPRIPESLAFNLQISKSPLAARHSPLATLQPWAFSYSVATVLLAVAMLGAWSYNVTHFDANALAKNSNRGAMSTVDAAQEPSEFTFVGRVSGMVDCQWADPNTVTVAGAGVALNRRYALRSGLMEISYDSGAKVILQGPCDYKVESARGGFLKVGKLVARVGARDEGRGTGAATNLPSPASGRGVGGEGSLPRSQSALTLTLSQGERGLVSNPQSLIPNPLFAVRTPTALVEDLGTEFGVEVLENGETFSHVFEGRVVMRAERAGDAGQGAGDVNPESPNPRTPNPPIFLSAGQSGRVAVEKSGAGKIDLSLASAADKPDHFIRELPLPLFCRHQLGVTGEFAAANDDLINAGRPTLAKIELSFGKALPESKLSSLNDGEIYGDKWEGNTVGTFTPSDGAVVTIELNTALHSQGYDIKRLVALTGSGGFEKNQRRSSQRFDVAYSTVDAPEKFIPLRCDRVATVDRDAHGWREMQVVLARAKEAPLARGAARLRLTFHNTDSPDPESMYREIDVFGEPSYGNKNDERR